MEKEENMRPVKKVLVGLNEKGELDLIETDEDEEGMYTTGEEE